MLTNPWDSTALYNKTTSFRKMEIGNIPYNIIITIILLILYYPICKWVYSHAKFLIGKLQLIK